MHIMKLDEELWLVYYFLFLTTFLKLFFIASEFTLESEKHIFLLADIILKVLYFILSSYTNLVQNISQTECALIYQRKKGILEV